jgi:GntR family transcriptional regulator
MNCIKRRGNMKIIVSNSSKDPIYEQISIQIKGMIIKGELQEGEGLPSIRGLAKDLQISVITTKRAYEELEKEGFIQTIQGKGSFVAMQNKDLMKEKKLKIIEEKLVEVVEESQLLGLKYIEVEEMLKILFEEVK